MAVNVLKRIGIGIAVLVGLCAFYVGYRQLYLSTGWTRPFVVDAYSMPPLQDIVSRLWEPAATEQPILVQVLIEKALFTAKEAAAGFVIGAIVGIAIGGDRFVHAPQSGGHVRLASLDDERYRQRFVGAGRFYVEPQ